MVKEEKCNDYKIKSFFLQGKPKKRLSSQRASNPLAYYKLFSFFPKLLAPYPALSRLKTASGLTTAQRALIDASVNDACFFSSKVSDAKLLEKMRNYIAEAAEGKRFRNRADFIREMRTYLGRSRSQDSGKLTDISSSRRLGLIFDFQQERLSAQIFLAQGDDEDHAWAFPCLELVRVSKRMVPRPWRERWVEAGGKLYDGRMIALRNDPIWRRISRFGSPVPPFDFNSGMGLEEVDRFEAEGLGIELPEDGEEVRELEDVPSDEEIDVAIQKIFDQVNREKIVAQKVAENAKEVAKVIGVRIGKPMSFRMANGLRANPNYKTGLPEYLWNCQSCVVANELRRRGLDVEATPYINQGLQKTLAGGNATAMWKTVDGRTPKEVYSGAISFFKTKEKALDELTKDVGRYFVTVFTAKNCGHIFTAERIKGGKLRLYDPQRGEVYKLAVWAKIKRKYGFRVLRVDNLVVGRDTMESKRRMSLDTVVMKARGSRGT